MLPNQLGEQSPNSKTNRRVAEYSLSGVALTTQMSTRVTELGL